MYYIKNAAVSKYLQNSGADAGVAAKDTSAETKYAQLWKITYVANGRYVIRPMGDTSEALTIGTSGYIAVANATSNNAALSSSYLWSIGRDSDGIYFQQNGVSSKTITTYITNTTIIVYPNTYNTNTFCHWTLEEVKGIFLRDTETSEIITSNTVKYIELGDSLSYSELGISYEYYGSLIGGLTWVSSSSSVASVDYYTGAVIGNSPCLATITLKANINGTYYSTSYCIYVKPISDGMYYISNNNLGYYVRIDSSASSDYSLSGTAMEISQLNAEDCYRWEIVHRENGYYSIISVESGLALTVPSDSLNSTSALIIQEAYTALDSQKWTFSLLSDGTYVIRPKSAESYITDWCMAIASTGSMYSFYLGQREYTEDTSFLSEWNLYRIGDQVLLLGITDEWHEHSAALANSIANLSAFGYGSFNFTVTGSTAKSAVIADMTQCHFYASRSHGNYDNDGTYIGLGNGAYVHSRDIFNYSTNTALVDFSACDVMLFVACYTANHDNCLPDAAVKAGADYAIGFTESIGCDTANTWTMKFIEYYSLGFDVATSANRAVTDCGRKNNIDSCLIFQTDG